MTLSLTLATREREDAMDVLASIQEKVHKAGHTEVQVLMCLTQGLVTSNSQVMFKIHDHVVRYRLGYMIKNGTKITEAIKAGRVSRRNFVTRMW